MFPICLPEDNPSNDPQGMCRKSLLNITRDQNDVLSITDRSEATTAPPSVGALVRDFEILERSNPNLFGVDISIWRNLALAVYGFESLEKLAKCDDTPLERIKLTEKN